MSNEPQFFETITKVSPSRRVPLRVVFCPMLRYPTHSHDSLPSETLRDSPAGSPWTAAIVELPDIYGNPADTCAVA